MSPRKRGAQITQYNMSFPQKRESTESVTFLDPCGDRSDLHSTPRPFYLCQASIVKRPPIKGNPPRNTQSPRRFNEESAPHRKKAAASSGTKSQPPALRGTTPLGPLLWALSSPATLQRLLVHRVTGCPANGGPPERPTLAAINGHCSAVGSGVNFGGFLPEKASSQRPSLPGGTPPAYSLPHSL